jgi:hypothetical protein
MKITLPVDQFIVLVAIASVCSSSIALPAYSRLFQAKYGYRVSCNICHTAGGGSTITDYGRDFLRAGGNFMAFSKIEKLDSDADGVLNIAEIRAKSNPGDARSTPTTPGEWLADANSISVPEKDLKKLFPTAEAFSALEGSLKPAQVTSVELQIGSKLKEEDKVPTFYFAVQGGKKIAVTQFVSAPSPKGTVPIAVAMDTKGVVSKIQVLKNPSDKAIESTEFLSQFKGKTKADGLQIGKDIQPAKGSEALSKEVALAVRKSILMINAVFGK